MTENKDSNRIFHIDFIRATFLLFIPLVHVLACWVQFANTTDMMTDESYIYLLITDVCPAFLLICMGMNITFSKRATPQFILKRGIALLIIGILLNFYQSMLMDLTFFVFTGDPLGIEILVESLTSDLLVLAGISLILLSFAYRWEIHPVYVLAVSMLMMLFNMNLTTEPLVAENAVQGIILALISNIISVDGLNMFALFNGFVFVAIGYCIGPIVKGMWVARKDMWMKLFVLSSIVIVLVLSTMDMYGISPLDLNIQDAPRMLEFFAMTILVMGSFAVAGAGYYVAKLIRSEKMRGRIISLSKSIMVFYVLQWVVISTFCCASNIICHYFPFNDPGMLVKLLVSIVITVFCVIVSTRIQRYIQKNSDRIPL